MIVLVVLTKKNMISQSNRGPIKPEKIQVLRPHVSKICSKNSQLRKFIELVVTNDQKRSLEFSETLSQTLLEEVGSDFEFSDYVVGSCVENFKTPENANRIWEFVNTLPNSESADFIAHGASRVLRNNFVDFLLFIDEVEFEPFKVDVINEAMRSLDNDVRVDVIMNTFEGNERVMKTLVDNLAYECL